MSESISDIIVKKIIIRRKFILAIPLALMISFSLYCFIIILNLLILNHQITGIKQYLEKNQVAITYNAKFSLKKFKPNIILNNFNVKFLEKHLISGFKIDKCNLSKKNGKIILDISNIEFDDTFGKIYVNTNESNLRIIFSLNNKYQINYLSILDNKIYFTNDKTNYDIITLDHFILTKHNIFAEACSTKFSLILNNGSLVPVTLQNFGTQINFNMQYHILDTTDNSLFSINTFKLNLKESQIDINGHIKTSSGKNKTYKLETRIENYNKIIDNFYSILNQYDKKNVQYYRSLYKLLYNDIIPLLKDGENGKIKSKNLLLNIVTNPQNGKLEINNVNIEEILEKIYECLTNIK